MSYTIKKCTVDNFTDDDAQFIYDQAEKLNKETGNHYDWESFKIVKFIETQHLWMCYRDSQHVGFMMATIYGNFFDCKSTFLKQNLLIGLPGTKAAKLLLEVFIDFGRRNANHVITVIGERTNIKPRSLERLGFRKLEEIYRLEN